MPIALVRRPKETYRFAMVYIPLGSILCTESELKSYLVVANVFSGEEKEDGAISLIRILSK